MSSEVLTNKADYFIARFLALSIVFYYFKTAFWPLTYLFVGCYTIFLILFIFRFDWNFKLFSFLKIFLLPSILAGVYLLLVIINGELANSILQKDLLLILIVFSFFYFLYIINDSLNIEIPKVFILYCIVFTTLGISLLNLLKLLYSDHISSTLLDKFHISQGNSLAFDYNFYSIFIILGLVVLIYNKNLIIHGKYSRLVYSIFVFLFTVNIILSGSRRGIFVFLILIVTYFAYNLNKIKYLIIGKKLIRNSIILISTLIILIFSGIIIFHRIPRDRISIMIFRYATFIGINDFNYINDKLWEPRNNLSSKSIPYLNFDSVKFDNKSWRSKNVGTNIRKIATAYGDGTRITYESLNRSELSIYTETPALPYFANHTYEISFKAQLIQGNIYSLNLGWWVDDLNNGNLSTFSTNKEISPLGNNWYSISAKYTFIENQFGIIFFISSNNEKLDFNISEVVITDLNHDSSIEKYPEKVVNSKKIFNWLNVVNPESFNDLNLISNGNFDNNLGFWAYSSDSLEIKIEWIDGIKCANIRRGNGDNDNWSLYYVGRNIEFKANNEYQIAFKLKPIAPKTIPFYIGFWVNEGEGYQINLKPHIDTIGNGWLNVKANYTFKNNQSNLVFPINSQKNNSQFYIADISIVNLTQVQYHPKPFQIKPEKTKTDSLVHNGKLLETIFAGRISRWLYARELWKSEYKWYNKILGHGFSFYDWFMKKFKTDSSGGDYPHNPFITILLYSGISGLSIYIWLLYKAFYIYISFRKKYDDLLICFLIAFFFSFFSGSSPFDPPIMGFFVMMPFYVFFIHTNKQID